MPHKFQQPKVDAAHRQAAQDMQAQVSSKAITDAYMRALSHAYVSNAMLTPERFKWREFFKQASKLPDVSLTVTFIKQNQGMRTMLCTFRGHPAPAGLPKYVRLWDLEAEGFRMVNLDGIIKVTMETNTCIPSLNNSTNL